MWEYTDKVKEHYLNPKNVGKIDDATVVAEVGNITCGDALKLYLKLGDNDTIEDVKFQTFGCGSAIATSSVLTELIKGKKLEEALKVTNQDIADFLGGLPPEKMHCSVMAQEALEKATKIYRGEPVSDEKEHTHEREKVICKCFGVTENKIREIVKENKLKTVDEVTYYSKAGGACGKCKGDIKKIIDDIYKSGEVEPDTSSEKKKLTNLQKINLIQDTINREIRPVMKKDGGDIELIDIVDNVVYVSLRGHCAECRAAQFTINGFVEKKLREIVDENIVVKETEK